MGFRDNKTGYPSDLLESRAVIKKGEYALLPPNGMVNNTIPGFSDCDTTILASPKLGATFVDYLVDIRSGGKTTRGFGGKGVESILYVISGRISASAGKCEVELTEGGYLFCPPSMEMNFHNKEEETAQIFLYKRRYKPLEDHPEPPVVTGNVSELEAVAYEGMADLKFYSFLPSAEDLSFDMNFHILSFEKGASHGYIETHVQEHGAYILSGSGMYNLANTWMPVKKGDYIFMGAYVQQVGYAVGQETSFSYVYSKDCNRDEEL